MTKTWQFYLKILYYNKRRQKGGDMSYLYAYYEKNKIQMFADTKVTFSENEKDILKKRLKNEVDYNNLVKFGIIKNVIINKNICIGSAGKLEHFNELLKYIETNKDYNIDSIKNKALDINIKYNDTTDFIIAYVGVNKKRIYLIHDNKLLIKDSCWIGDDVTNSLFEKYNKESDTSCSNAFECAIIDSKENSVGGFAIQCCETNGEFRYPEMMKSSVERKQILLPNQPMILFDSIQNGGFTHYYFESSDIVSVYIYQMKSGVRYIPCIDDEKYSFLRIPKVYHMGDVEFQREFKLTPPTMRIL